MPSLSALTKEIGAKFKRSNPDIIFDRNRQVDWISSGNIVFDLVTGGGFPRRRITEVFGMEHSGKTAITLTMAGHAQRSGLTGVFMDHEQSWFAQYAERNYGLVQDNDTFSVFQPDNIEEGDTIVDMLEKLGQLDYIIFDSIDAMRPKSMVERNQADDSRIPGSHAYAMSQLIHKLVPWARRMNCAVIMINQMRTAISTNKYEQSIGSAAGYNPMESYATTGGHAPRFYASLRVKMEYGGQLNNEAGTDQVSGLKGAKVRTGQQTKIINVKNKVHTPYLKGLSNFIFPTDAEPGGFSRGLDLLDLLKKRNRVRQVSTKFIYNGLDPQYAEWTNMGSKLSSEEKFCSNPALLADAEALLKSLMKQSSEPALELAIKGEDFSEDEASEAKFQPNEEELSLVLDDDANSSSPSSEDDSQPIAEVTL